MNLEQLSATDIGKLVNKKEIKPTEILNFFENRILKYNDKVNAFVYTKFEEAYKEAKKIEDRLAKNENIGLFAGVPFGLKDFLPNKPGWTNSHGGVKCLISTDTIYSEFCKAMEKAGGIAVGKTNAPAYGFRGTTDNRLYGPTCNPFNLKYNSGGSSGGSAAAVASSLVPIAEGGDAGGSIRLPASWCNLFGYKPGLGVVPSVIRPDAWSATHPFCFNFALTKTVEDAKTLLYYMAYYNRKDPYSLDGVLPKEFFHSFSSRYFKDFKKPRIAITYDFGLFEVDNSIKERLSTISDILRRDGFEVEDIDFNFKYSNETISEYWCKALIFDSVIELEQDKKLGNDYIKDYPEQFPEEISYWVNKCKTSTIDDLYTFNLIRTDILDNFENVFDNYDFIISPVSACTPVINANDRNTKGPEYINDKKVDPLIGWALTYLANFTGHPAASVPIGILDNNLPVGMQVMSKKYYDAELLSFCKYFEDIQPWSDNYKLINLDK